MTTITVPDFNFSSFYYPEILEALFQFKRRDAPELTDESPQEPTVQMLRAFALVGHLNNTLIDLVAGESTLATARLQETVRNMLSLIDYALHPATPAQVELVYELAQVISSAQIIVTAFARAASPSSAEASSRFFEADAEVLSQRTDRLLACFGVEAGVFTDYTAKANDGTAGQDFTPWVTPAQGSGGSGIGSEGDSLYLCHGQIMPTELDIAIKTAASGIAGVWEYFDGKWTQGKADSVTNNGSTLSFVLTPSFLTSNWEGLRVRVVHVESGAFEDCYVNGSCVAETVGLLGQSSPSTDPDDYTIAADWRAFTNQVDATSDLTVSDTVALPLPESVTQKWSKATFETIEGFWLRYRIVSVATPVAPAIDRVRIDTGKQYAKVNATQGRSQTETLGSSDGSADQSFETSKDYFVSGSDSLLVNGISWSRVDNFLASRPTDRHYRITTGVNDRASVVFGDGVTGAIPPIGVNNVVVSYRYGANEDGNVGARTITQDREGLVLVNALWNPRAAAGWAQAQGSDEASLARAKIEGPASLRVRDVALGPDDAAILATRAADLDSSVIRVTRAKGIEEGFGPKTVELVVVPAGGALASQPSLDALSEFFNGNQFVTPAKAKRFVANQEVTAVNYTQRTIDIVANVWATGAVTAAQIRAALVAVLQPEARKEDGVSYEWEFGAKIPTSRFDHLIHDVDPTVTEVDLVTINGVAPADVILASRELPVAGTITINLNP